MAHFHAADLRDSQAMPPLSRSNLGWEVGLLGAVQRQRFGSAGFGAPSTVPRTKGKSVVTHDEDSDFQR